MVGAAIGVLVGDASAVAMLVYSDMHTIAYDTAYCLQFNINESAFFANSPKY